jgi:uncharacterized membrane protein
MPGLTSRPTVRQTSDSLGTAMNHSHIWICISLGALTVLLATLGAGLVAFVPAAGCAVMCIHMIWTMVRGGESSSQVG